VKVLFFGTILAFTGVGAGGIGDDEIETAVKVATVSLKREMTSLKEQLELFEMKHETLQAASEQFRMQSKSAKTKLEEERKRYDVLSLEKQSLDMSIESKLENALKNQKATFDTTIAAELIEKKKLLAKENEVLVQKLRRTEHQISMLEGDWKEKLEEQSKRYEISEEKRLASEEKQRTEAADLRKRLSYSEKQAKSFEDSWKNGVLESEAKDQYFQEESGKRLDEASRWEKRLQKLNTESKDLYEDNKAKEIELVRSKKLHLTLLEKLTESDEAVREHEKKIVTFTADIERLTSDLTSTSGELSASKKDYSVLSKKFENLSNLHHDTEITLEKVRTEEERNIARNKQLQNELVDVKFEFDTSQKKTKQTIEEKSEMTKSYTEALEQLSSKNTFLRHELADIKFELEQSESETDVLKAETAEITYAHQRTLERLESDGKTLKSLQIEYTIMKKEFETIADQFKASEEKVKNYKQRIEEEAAVNEELQKELLYSELKIENGHKIEMELTDGSKELFKMYEDIQKTMGSSEKNLLETMQQYQKSEAHVEVLQGSVHKLEEKVEGLIDQLEMRELKNSFLQKSLLETKFDLEESQNKVKLLEGQMTETSTDSQDHGTLEIENREMRERAQKLELELQESTSSYNVAIRKIDDLREQLNATQTRSAHILNMYEEMKEENETLNRNLRASQEHKSEFNSVNLELRERNESFEQCGKDLHETKEEYSKLMKEYDAAKEELEMRQMKPQIVEKNLEHIESESESKGEINEVEIEKTKVSVAEHPANDTNGSERPTAGQKSQKQSRGSFFSFFRRLDYALYTILRVIVDSMGFLMNGLLQGLSSSMLYVRIVAPFKSFFAVASWAFNEFGIIHDALVSLFEFEMTFVSSLVSSEKDRTIFVFLIRHSQMFVMFGEAIAMLLCIDFVVSSFMNPIKARKRRPKAKTIYVPKTATASLLRKANNM
jgi:hypothetical protein